MSRFLKQVRKQAMQILGESIHAEHKYRQQVQRLRWELFVIWTASRPKRVEHSE